jgi:hypothetical protein
MKLHITCKEATDFISRKEEGKLVWWKQWQLAQHLAICSLCRLFDVQSRQIAESMKQLDSHAHAGALDSADKEKIVEILENDNRESS